VGTEAEGAEGAEEVEEVWAEVDECAFFCCHARMTREFKWACVSAILH
jgi:hypothetical protein